MIWPALEFSFNWPWRAFFGEKRFFREVMAEDVRAIWDCRKTASEPDGGNAKRRQNFADRCPSGWLSDQASAEILTPGRSWYLQDFSAEFDERKLGTIQAAGAEITRGDIRQTLGTLSGETAWKKGSLYMADVALQDGVRVENFEMQLARPEGLALALEASVFGGGLRADVAYGTGQENADGGSGLVDVQHRCRAPAAPAGLEGKGGRHRSRKAASPSAERPLRPSMARPRCALAAQGFSLERPWLGITGTRRQHDPSASLRE